jgi:hypothetical protein
MTRNPADLKDDVLINLLCSEGDRLSRRVIDEIVRRGNAVVDPLTWMVIDVNAWRSGPPAHWAPIHATFALGAIGGENTLLGLLTAAEHAAACGCEPVIAALPSIFGRFGAGARPYLFERLRDRGRGPDFRALMARCLAATTLYDPEGADAVFAEISSVSTEIGDAVPNDAIERGLAAFRRTRDGDGVNGFVDNQDWLARYPSEDVVGRRSEEPAVRDTEVDVGQDEWEPEPIAQVTRRQPKIGRNASCHCGSGKKYKKCCLEVDAALEPLGI